MPEKNWKPKEFDKIDKDKTAVALAFEPGDVAPKILASGKGAVADKIIEKARLLNLLPSAKATLHYMSRPEKIYCDNTNIMYSLCESINVGTERETFFLNQIRSAGLDAKYPEKGDFLVDGRYLFEVGGKDKKFDQIRDIPDSFLAVDDTESGWNNRIPLWMFGMLY